MFNVLARLLPSWKNVLLAILAAGLLILAFPDLGYWFLAWFALVPLMWAVEREKGSTLRAFIVGWKFGTVFFVGTCWWLTYAPIHYAGFPWPLAYFLLLLVCLAVGLFPAVFAAILSILLRRFGAWGFLAAPFVWVLTEFLRFWVTGNNWNAVGYSQYSSEAAGWASLGGVLSVSFVVVLYNVIARGLLSALVLAFPAITGRKRNSDTQSVEERSMFQPAADSSDDDLNPLLLIGAVAVFVIYAWITSPVDHRPEGAKSTVVAIQPNVPMAGLDSRSLERLRQQQIELAESKIRPIRSVGDVSPITVILPESPMNFMYTDDREFQQFIGDFARRNNVSVLFNSAEPDAGTGKYFNSAVMVGSDGRRVDQYDKIYLLPFGEAVPPPLEGILPGFVGNFSYGREYDLFPVGDAKAGVMICFESHFGALSREYVKNGADVIIEMTNDGYLGPTPVLRQHLANAVFRAVETNRPVLRVTNVGVTAYITPTGHVIDAAPAYQEDTRVWSVSKSDGSQTFYVRYGDWFAWFCTIVTMLLIGLSIRRKPGAAEARSKKSA